MSTSEGTALSEPVGDSERGATATEYAVLIAFMVLAIIAGVTIFGAWLGGYYAGMGQELRDVLR
ncbi:Flp family type IVb pilin [Sinomonas atrocyanea]